MVTLSRDQIDKYHAHGFLHVRNVIDFELLKDMFESFEKLRKKYTPSSMYHELASENWLDSLLIKDLIKLRQSHPNHFGALYDSLKLCVPIHSLFCNKIILEITSTLLNEYPQGMCTTGHMLRMDVPKDSKNPLDWHQDSAYYLQNKIGLNGLVCWLPLVPVDSQNGTISICISSHREGKIAAEAEKEGNTFYSEQFKIGKNYLSKYEKTEFIANVGDAGFFNMDIIHKSGVNSSKHIRFVAGCRFHRMLSDDFTTGELKYIPHKY